MPVCIVGQRVGEAGGIILERLFVIKLKIPHVFLER